jgi:hypothetical protein
MLILGMFHYFRSGRQKLDPDRMKAAVTAVRKKEMEVSRCLHFQSASNNTREIC